MKTKAIAKRLKGKMCRSKVYEHLRLFFYHQEFLKWLKSSIGKELSAIDGNFSKRWRYIHQFEDISPEGNANLSKSLHQIYDARFEISDEDILDLFEFN